MAGNPVSSTGRVYNPLVGYNFPLFFGFGGCFLGFKVMIWPKNHRSLWGIWNYPLTPKNHLWLQKAGGIFQGVKSEKKTTMGPPKPTFLEVFMVNNLVFRWPKPLFFMVLGAHGIYIKTIPHQKYQPFLFKGEMFLCSQPRWSNRAVCARQSTSYVMHKMKAESTKVRRWRGKGNPKQPFFNGCLVKQPVSM